MSCIQTIHHMNSQSESTHFNFSILFYRYRLCMQALLVLSANFPAWAACISHKPTTTICTNGHIKILTWLHHHSRHPTVLQMGGSCLTHMGNPFLRCIRLGHTIGLFRLATSCRCWIPQSPWWHIGHILQLPICQVFKHFEAQLIWIKFYPYISYSSMALTLSICLPRHVWGGVMIITDPCAGEVSAVIQMIHLPQGISLGCLPLGANRWSKINDAIGAI
jgi:hypothetical protein